MVAMALYLQAMVASGSLTRLVPAVAVLPNAGFASSSRLCMRRRWRPQAPGRDLAVAAGGLLSLTVVLPKRKVLVSAITGGGDSSSSENEDAGTSDEVASVESGASADVDAAVSVSTLDFLNQFWNFVYLFEIGVVEWYGGI